MKNLTNIYSNSKQAVLPILIHDYLDICDPVLTFDRFMEEIELEKYLKKIPKHYTGRLRYNPVSMLKTILFGFMTNGYISLRELEDSCKVNLRFMYLMDHETPSYRTFGYFINKILADSIEDIFNDINKKIFETEHVDLQHLYIDGSKFESNANKSPQQRHYEKLMEYAVKLEEYTEKIKICGEKRNSYSKTDHSATFMRIKTDYMGNDQLLPAYSVQIGVADEYIAVIDVNQYRSDMDCFIPLMNKFQDIYGFYPKYPVVDAHMQRNVRKPIKTELYVSIRS